MDIICYFLLLLLIIMPTTVLSNKIIFEDSTNLCQKCHCKNNIQFILDCRQQGFHYTIANWPKHNVQLIATFSYNNITTLEVLPNSDKVTHLIFDHCGIRNLDNGVFKAVKNVLLVDLSYNFLTTEEIASTKFNGPYNHSIYQPLAIQDLNLAYNLIHSLPYNIFEHLYSLKQLNLEGNQLKILDSPTRIALAGLHQLEILNLANNELKEIGNEPIQSWKKLKEFNLAFNQFDQVPEALALLGNSLEFLYLDSNPIMVLNDESFLGLKHIVKLSINNLPKIKYVLANTFAPMKNLKILYLSNCTNLIRIDRDAFGNNQTLLEFYIENNALNHLEYNLTKWSTIEMLNMKGNRFDCTCDLYHIVKELNLNIIRNKNGPVCINTITDESMMVYDLKNTTCNLKRSTLRIMYLKRSYEKMTIFLTTALVILILISLATAKYVLFKYRQGKINLFTAKVIYNPITNLG